MKFGLRYASLGRYASGPAAVELAQAAEAAGFDSIWTVEHVVVPHGYQSRYPYSETGRMGSGLEDFPIPDPLIWLAYIASAMRAWWSQERASFAGRFVSFRDVFCRPQPADGRIPIVVGGDTRAAARRAGRLGDGYFPARGASDELLGEMRRAAVEAGRDPAQIEITVSAPTEATQIEALARRGVKRVAVPVSSAAGLPAQVRTPDD